MAYAFVSGVAATKGSAGNLTTGSITTTGADLIVVSVMDDNRQPAATLSDSNSNSYTGLTIKSSSDFATNRLFYKQAPTVGAGHTFTLTGIGNVGALAVAAFSGSIATPFDVENGATTGFGGGDTIATGSITPTVNDEIAIAGLGAFHSGTPTIGSSYSLVAEAHSNATAAIAYLIQTTAGATNPTWTDTGASRGMAATIASFKSSGGGGGGGGKPWYVYAQQCVQTRLERRWERWGLLWTPAYGQAVSQES